MRRRRKWWRERESFKVRKTKMQEMSILMIFLSKERKKLHQMDSLKNHRRSLISSSQR